MRFMGMWVMVVMMLSFFAIGKAVYQDDNTTDIYNYTSSNLKWNTTNYNKYNNPTYNMTNSQSATQRLLNVIYKGIDTTGFIVFEIAKWGIEAGFRNPEWNYLWLMKWLGILLIITICLPLLYFLPLLLALIYLAYIGIKRIVKWAKERWGGKNRKR